MDLCHLTPVTSLIEHVHLVPFDVVCVAVAPFLLVLLVFGVFYLFGFSAPLLLRSVCVFSSVFSATRRRFRLEGLYSGPRIAARRFPVALVPLFSRDVHATVD